MMEEDLIQIILSYWPSMLIFLGFGLFHSICAREPFKEALGRITSPFFVEYFWRIIYCFISYYLLYYTFFVVLYQHHPEQSVLLKDYPLSGWVFMYILRLVGVFLTYWAFLQSDYLEFLGFKQAYKGILKLLGKTPPPQKVFGTDRLEIHGVYGWIRHPMLAGGFWFIVSLPLTINNLIFLCFYSTYMVIGMYYEEERLVRVFGEDYVSYQKRVGALFPKTIFPVRSV
ncbi:MAG: hypothetical protein QGI45_15265 [Myxococcota bacterium]|jgi:hypothetical protein|nr:hypothetical protein [Myxococcota bacterium]